MERIRFRLAAWYFGALLVAVMAGGCQAAAPEEAERSGDAERDVGREMDAAALVGLEPREGVLEAEAGPLAKRRLAFELRSADDDEPGDWVLEIEDRQLSYWSVDEEGGVGLLVHEDFLEGVRVRYEPALSVVPGKLDGQDVEQQVQMRIEERETGRRVASGEGRITTRVRGPERVETFAGEREAWTVEQEQDLRLTAARVSVRMETSYVPGLGRVEERIERQQRVLGLFGETREELYRRVE